MRFCLENKNKNMNTNKLFFVAFLSLILVSCDDARVYEIVDIDGRDHRLNTFSGELAVVANNTLVRIPETEFSKKWVIHF